MELEIDPAPDEAERRAIAAALAQSGSPPEPDAWRAAALEEGVDDSLDP